MITEVSKHTGERRVFTDAAFAIRHKALSLQRPEGYATRPMNVLWESEYYWFRLHDILRDAGAPMVEVQDGTLCQVGGGLK
jgi:hypothetical protein